MQIEILSKIFIIIGVFFILLGLLIKFSKILPFGHLPGDIFIQKDNFSFYFPIATSILISIFLSLILFFLNKK